MKNKWKVALFCSNCHTELSMNDKMCNWGCCPYCGVRSGATIVKTYSKSYRYKKQPWYKFWKFERVWNEQSINREFS